MGAAAVSLLLTMQGWYAGLPGSGNPIDLVSRTQSSVLYAALQSRDPYGRKFHGPRIQQRTTPRAQRVETRANALMARHRIRDTRNVFSPQSR